MSGNYNWGILAAGNIAGKFVAELAAIERANVLAVASRDIGRAENFAQKHGIERFYGSYEELAADPDLDIIYIATPHPFHAEHTILCLRHKKAVLCEKAFAMDTTQVKEMIRTAQQEQTFLMEALFTPHQPSYQEAKRLVASGQLGKIKHIHGWFGFNKSPYDLNGRLFNPVLGGGALLDIGLYPLFDVLWFLGEPAKIHASADLTDRQIDQSLTVLLEYPDGGSATIFASFLASAGLGTDILCEKGTLRLRRNSSVDQTLEIHLPGAMPRVMSWPESASGLKLEALDVMGCLDRQMLESGVMSHQNSLQLIGLLDRIREQAGITYDV